MIPYSRRAALHITALLDHYSELDRPEAMRNLLAAMREASAMIEEDPSAGLPAPRPYPALARPGRLWVKAGRYWIGYRRRPSLGIVAVFYDAADIPGRIE